jgi:hypothetical protein
VKTYFKALNINFVKTYFKALNIVWTIFQLPRIIPHEYHVLFYLVPHPYLPIYLVPNSWHQN